MDRISVAGKSSDVNSRVFPPDAQSVQGPRFSMDYFISNEVRMGFVGRVVVVVEREYEREA
jgi:hypothetical protein